MLKPEYNILEKAYTSVNFKHSLSSKEKMKGSCKEKLCFRKDKQSLSLREPFREKAL